MTRANVIQINWTQTEVEKLKSMWLQGKSVIEIMSEIPRSEQSIRTKAKKIKLKRPNKKVTAISTFKELERGIKKNVTPYVQPPFTGGKLLSDLSRLECHYPHKGQIYCGEPTNRADGYCDAHHALCYKPVVIRARSF